MNSTTYNTRIAPSPTGHFHMGTARTAYINYLAARSTGGKFILRIDDTDTLRNNDIYVDGIINTMNWLGLDYDVIFKQSDRLDRYNKVAASLIDAGKAIYKDGAIFLNVIPSIQNWKDMIGGVIDADGTMDPNMIVLMKSDGMPTYHFATVVDDMDYNVNLIIRGTDHISNTAKHLYIYQALDGIAPDYAHVGLIHFKGSKLSKRDGASSMQFYRDAGYLPAAVLNILLRMGWSHPDPNFDKIHKFIPKDLAIKIFWDGKLKASSSSLDMSKLDYYNNRYKVIDKKPIQA